MNLYDTAAEQAYLGAVLLSPRRARTAGIQVTDLDPAGGHDRVLDAVLAALDAGGGVDELVILDQLTRRGDLSKVGHEELRGAVYLHKLIDSCPTVANIDFYALKIRQATTRRTLHGLGERLQQIAQQPDHEDLLDAAASLSVALEIAVEEPLSSKPIEDLHELGKFVDQPVPPHQWIIPGVLERQERVIFVAGEGSGKALGVATPIPTPKGWATMGSLSVGDDVFAPDGSPTRIIAATEVLHDRPCYRVIFSDGAEVIADANHQWLTETLAARKVAAQRIRDTGRDRRGTDQRYKRVHFPAVQTTEEIGASLWARNGHALNHSIEVCEPLQYPRQEQRIDPYVLGAWLGDGTTVHADITSADTEIIDEIRAAGVTVTRKKSTLYGWHMGYGDERRRRISQARLLIEYGCTRRSAERSVGLPRDACSEIHVPRTGWRKPNLGDTSITPLRSLQEDLRTVGVLGNKHIPGEYLHAAVDQRIALLQGLMDTDGTVSSASGHGRGSGAPSCEFSVTSERLARDVRELLLGLGIKVTWRQSNAVLNGRIVGLRFRLAFQTALPVFRLPRKAERLTPLRTRRAKLRYITAVEPVASVPVRCIQVEREDGMFVAGEQCIPTHNSFLTRQIAVLLASGRHPFEPTIEILAKRTLLVDLENPPNLVRRKTRGMVTKARRLGVWADGNAFCWMKPSGLDLRRRPDQQLLERVIVETRPELVCIGPLYKMFTGGNDSYEQAAGEVAKVLDRLREKHGVALWIEHHMPKGSREGRDLIPFGSSLWQRWPEFGRGMVLDPEDDNHWLMAKFRPDRDERIWPTGLTRGGEWPWTAVYHDGDKGRLKRIISGDDWGDDE